MSRIKRPDFYHMIRNLVLAVGCDKYNCREVAVSNKGRRYRD